MEAYSHQKRSRNASKGMLCVGMLILFALLLSACGSNTTTTSGRAPHPIPRQLQLQLPMT